MSLSLEDEITSVLSCELTTINSAAEWQRVHQRFVNEIEQCTGGPDVYSAWFKQMIKNARPEHLLWRDCTKSLLSEALVRYESVLTHASVLSVSQFGKQVQKPITHMCLSLLRDWNVSPSSMTWLHKPVCDYTWSDLLTMDLPKKGGPSVSTCLRQLTAGS